MTKPQNPKTPKPHQFLDLNFDKFCNVMHRGVVFDFFNIYWCCQSFFSRCPAQDFFCGGNLRSSRADCDTFRRAWVAAAAAPVPKFDFDVVVLTLRVPLLPTEFLRAPGLDLVCDELAAALGLIFQRQLLGRLDGAALCGWSMPSMDAPENLLLDFNCERAPFYLTLLPCGLSSYSYSLICISFYMISLF